MYILRLREKTNENYIRLIKNMYSILQGNFSSKLNKYFSILSTAGEYTEYNRT